MTVFEEKVNFSLELLMGVCQSECDGKNYDEISEFFYDDFTQACYECSTHINEKDFMAIYAEKKPSVDSIMQIKGHAPNDLRELYIAVCDLIQFTIMQQVDLAQEFVSQDFRERVINESHGRVSAHINLEAYTERFSEVQDEELEAQVMVEEKAVFAEHLNKKLAPKQAAPNKKKI